MNKDEMIALPVLLGWTPWVGGDMPHLYSDTVMVIYRGDDLDEMSTRFLRENRMFKPDTVVWQHYDTAPESDVIAYQEICRYCSGPFWIRHDGSIMPGIGVPCDCRENQP